MKYESIFQSGFSKLCKIKSDVKQIETPTIMTIQSNEKNSWIIGDSDHFSLSFPENFFDTISPLNKEHDFHFIVNFFMPKTINESILEKQLALTRQKIDSIIKAIDLTNLIALIQPTDSEVFLKKVLKCINDYDIKNLAITNLLPIINNQRKLVDFLGTIKTTIPIDSYVFLLSPVPHTLIPILTYIGIDIFSDSFSWFASQQAIYLTDSGGVLVKELKERICNCEVCTNIPSFDKFLVPLEKKENNKSNLIRSYATHLENHNHSIFIKKMRETRNSLKNKDLRSFVEQTIQNNVFSAATLRLLDNFWSDLIITRTPTWAASNLKCITSYSYTRPCIKAFQKRILERFRIPSQKKVVVLFPCSAKKPYSESKSHMLYIEALKKIDRKKQGYLQEIILTSPLGVVPRELETVFPAAHYDVPVTGDWSYEEKEIAIKQLVGVLTNWDRTNCYIVAHVSDEYLELCEKVEEILGLPFIYTSLNDKTTSSTSLNNLTEKIRKVTDQLPIIPFAYHDLVKIRAIADYQFGLGLGSTLFAEACVLKRKGDLPFQIFSQNEQIGIIQPSTGQLILSLRTGELLAKTKKYYVTFDGNKIEGSTLFAVGILNADPDIRPSDEVVILDKNQILLGIGQALISGKDMMNVKKGAAVKIRTKKS